MARATGKEWLLMKQTDPEADPQFRRVSALTPAKRRRLSVLVAPPCEAS